jgi:uncharacterized membrane protein
MVNRGQGSHLSNILMFVVLMPFSTSLIGDYGCKTTAIVFVSQHGGLGFAVFCGLGLRNKR